MTRAAIPLVAYGALLTGLAVILRIWDSDPLPPLMLGVAAVAMWLTGVVWFLHARRVERDPDRDVRAVPDLSAPSALLGLAITMMLVGLHLGAYAVLVGGGLGALAVGGLVREALAVRRARREEA